MFRVKELAELQGMNITQLANKANMAYSLVHGIWTNKTKRPALTTLESIASALDVPVWALFEGAPMPNKENTATSQLVQ